MNSYYDSQPPADSFPISKADAFVKRARQQAKDDMPRAPEPSFRHRQDLADFDRMNEIPNEMATGQNSWRQGVIQAGHISDQQSAANANEKNINWNMRHKANAYNTERSRLQGRLSDRDVEWQERKDDKAYERSQGDRRWAAEQEATQYQRGRDARNDANQDRQDRLQYALQKMRSNDEILKAEGQEEYDQIMSESRPAAQSSATGPKAAAFIQQAQQSPGTMPYRPGAGADGEKVMPYSPGAPATARQNDPAAAPAPSAQAPRPVSRYMEEAIKDKAARRQREDEERQDAKVQKGYDFQKRRADDAEGAHNRQLKIKLDQIQTALAETTEPAERTRLLNAAASLTSSLPQLVNKPEGTHGLRPAIADAMQNGWDAADKSGRAAAGQTFKSDAFAQKAWENKRNREATSGESNADAAQVQQAVTNLFSSDIAALKGEITRAKDLPWRSDLNNAARGAIGTSGADYENENGMDDGAVLALKNKIDDLVARVVKSSGGSPASARSEVIRGLMPLAQDASLVGKQLRWALAGQ